MEIGRSRERRDADQHAGNERDQCLVDLRGRLSTRRADTADGKRPRDGQRACAGTRANDRAGKGPYILEMLTYRYRGHSMSDPAKYRTREEVQKMRTEHDPIEQVRERILEKKLGSEDDLKKIDAQVRDLVNEAAEFATNDPEPDIAELWTDVYR